MSDPFRIDGPAHIAFSGGRTSGYMLRRILDAGLDQDVFVLFADTGKERAETYDFVRACSTNWGIEIHWCQRPGGFAQLITDRNYLPNPVTRFCTTELKIRPMKEFMRARGFDEWTNVVGIRADEPRRVARMREPTRERWEVYMPLAKAGVTLADVTAFWKAQPFDLELAPWEGNCDLCFLKGAAKRKRIMEDRPDLAEWWIEQERRIGGRFRYNGPSYETLARNVAAQVRLPFTEAGDDLGDCICHD